MITNGVSMTEEERRLVVQGPGDVEWKSVVYICLSLCYVQIYDLDTRCVASARKSYLVSFWALFLHPNLSKPLTR